MDGVANIGMVTELSTQGVVLYCDQAGVILKVVQNSLGVPEEDLVGKSFPQLVDDTSRRKAFSFLVSLKASGSLFGWELDMPVGGQMILAHCAGLVLEGNLLILAARSQTDIQHLFDQMMRINNEQLTLLRRLTKEQAALTPSRADLGIRFYEEMTRVNNELIALQRELVRKNMELEQLNTEVQRLAVTDALTGLYNRRGFFELGVREVERTQRYGRPFGIMMLDVDHFKQINDTFGHAAGDRVLESVAARCRSQLRTPDIMGRYGGEEFSVILLEIALPRALEVAERLRRVVASEPVDTMDGPLAVTVSVGLAVLEGSSMSLDEVLRMADKALYMAKEAGRNRVCVYDPGQPG